MLASKKEKSSPHVYFHEGHSERQHTAAGRSRPGAWLMHGSAPLCNAAIADVPAVRHVLHRDYETRSRISLKLVGAHRYAADSSTEILCAAYAVDDDPVRLWLPGDPIPSEFVEAATNSSWSTCAHGDHFESAIEQTCWRRATAGPWFRSSGIAAQWPCRWRLDYQLDSTRLRMRSS
jgi:hypothetical protein